MSQNRDELKTGQQSEQTDDVDETQNDSDAGQDNPPEEKLAPEEGANVILAHGMSPVTYPTKEHKGEVNIGMDVTIELPSEAQQRAGFKLSERNVTALITQYGSRYKRFKVLAPANTDRQQGREGGEA